VITFLGYASVMLPSILDIFQGFTDMLRGISQQYVETAESSSNRSFSGDGWFSVGLIEKPFGTGFSDV
jgi:hypothetical protein